jgi:hypothetical protein
MDGVRLEDYPDIAGSVVQDTEVVYSGAVKEDRNFADKPRKCQSRFEEYSILDCNDWQLVFRS